MQGVVGLTRGAIARAIRPYLLIGASGVTLDPDRSVPGPGVPEGQTSPPTGSGDVIIVDGTTNLVLTMDRLGFETRFAVELAGGLDLRLPLVHTLRATVGAVIDVGLPDPPPRTVAAAEP